MCLSVTAGALSQYQTELLFNPSPPSVKVNSNHGNPLSSWSEGAQWLCGWTFIFCIKPWMVNESDISRFGEAITSAGEVKENLPLPRPSHAAPDLLHPSEGKRVIKSPGFPALVLAHLLCADLSTSD